jgi:hypothetical protein
MADLQITTNVIMSTLGALTALGTIWVSIGKISKGRNESKAMARAEILQTAKEEVASLKRDIEARFTLMDIKMEQIKESTEQDLSHLKETHSNEMENLSEKLELLREDLKSQHNQIMTLMGNLLDRNIP